MSDLEDIADRLRALARDAGPLSAELEAVARELLAIGREAESLSRLGFGGAQVLGLITQAVTHARNGADAVAQVGAKGLDWADHLANRASGSISASPGGSWCRRMGISGRTNSRNARGVGRDNQRGESCGWRTAE
jgi:hypothetical protein